MMNESPRLRQIEIIKSRLNWPRLQISLILLLTGVSGFLVSLILLHAGLDSMVLRYPLAIAAAYCFFLFLLRIWLWMHGRELPGSIDFPVPIEMPAVGSASDSAVDQTFEFGGGGDFAGGGAGGQWAGANLAAAPSSPGSSVLDNVSIDVDADGFPVLILIIVGLVVALLALILFVYVIYIAPVLLAEILLDGVLVAGLYRSVKKTEQRHWLSTALRKTAIPAILVIIIFGVAGWVLQKAVPEARSIGEYWRIVTSE
jgi:hypothetical protein